MNSAALPQTEAERLNELFSYLILDTEPETQFEEIVKLAAHICGTPISLITLLDEHRQWFKARVGLDFPETARDISFCSHAIAGEQDRIYEIKNATVDERFQDNPLVTGNPHIQFYAGYPLITANGHKLGTLCVIDTKEKELNTEQKMALELLAKQVIKELELRRAYRQLTQRSQLLNGLISNIPVIAYRLNVNGQFTEVVGSGLSLINPNHQKLEGVTSNALFPGLSDELASAQEQNQKSFVMQTQTAGITRYHEHYFSADETQPGGLIGFALDITKRQQMELELNKAKQKAEQATQAKSSFLANISHEIRTPIHAILGFTEVLKKQQQSVQSQEYLNYISASGELLLKLLGDVLDITKIEEGKLQIQEQPFHLTEVLKSNIHPYQYRAQEKGLKFSLNLAQQLPEYVIGDAGRISQIIINLIGNALKFTHEGAIKVDVSWQQTPGTHLKIEVTDTGIGIPADKQAQIFNTFTQADASINRQYGGSGLGLAIVKELVEHMHGQIGVISPAITSNNAGGSTFWFTIPLVETRPDQNTAATENQAPTAPEVNYHGQAHVLLVDDNELNQRLGAIMIQNLGCQVGIADNGQEAIDLMQQNAYDLILMDVQMPVLNGYQATKWIRSQFNATVPIIGLSASVDKAEIDQCFQVGMNDYLGKPYSEKSLREKIQQWLPINLNSPKESQSAAKPATNNITDLTFLKELMGNDFTLVTEMIREFTTQQQLLMNKMEVAFKEYDYEAIAALAHNMRSSVMTVGLEVLQEPLTLLEAHCRHDPNAATVINYLAEIKKLNTQAELELNKNI